MVKRGLGRGLDALLPSATPAAAGGVREIPLRDIAPSRLQPRQRFDPEKLAELAASIKEHGVVQPIIVRPAERGYELVIGERRWRAAREAGLDTIPAVVKDMGSDEEVMAVALVENLQREDLNPLEEASAYQYLIQEFGLTQEEVARRVGRSRPQVANTLRLLNLDPEVREEIQAGRLTMGHAKALLSLADRAAQKQLVRRILEKGLSVRETEEEARRLSTAKRGSAPPHRSVAESPFAEVEQEMRDALGTRVRVTGGPERGRIEIDFFSPDDLARIVDLITGRTSGVR